jgi:hypothetical protein
MHKYNIDDEVYRLRLGKERLPQEVICKTCNDTGFIEKKCDCCNRNYVCPDCNNKVKTYVQKYKNKMFIEGPYDIFGINIHIDTDEVKTVEYVCIKSNHCSTDDEDYHFREEELYTDWEEACKVCDEYNNAQV